MRISAIFQLHQATVNNMQKNKNREKESCMQQLGRTEIMLRCWDGFMLGWLLLFWRHLFCIFVALIPNGGVWALKMVLPFYLYWSSSLPVLFVLCLLLLCHWFLCVFVCVTVPFLVCCVCCVCVSLCVVLCVCVSLCVVLCVIIIIII